MTVADDAVDDISGSGDDLTTTAEPQADIPGEQNLTGISYCHRSRSPFKIRL